MDAGNQSDRPGIGQLFRELFQVVWSDSPALKPQMGHDGGSLMGPRASRPAHVLAGNHEASLEARGPDELEA